jgi:D-alanyl-D-alanine carboxypeptidase/D-alanyl-D-alanine-endopeptidase (penicillin-binding protein 4)
LLYAPQTPWYDLFFDSLPLAGVDGTLKYRFHKNGAYSQARLKTGFLESTRALAGYVDDFHGRRYAVVILLNHANAKRSAPAMDTIIEDIHQGVLSPLPQTAKAVKTTQQTTQQTAQQATAAPKGARQEPHRGRAAPG